MLITTTIKVAIKSLLANKLRSFLAMLGIIIGVGAVISMLAIGAGAKIDIMERISLMGTNLLSVRPGQAGQHGVMEGTRQNLTVEDAEAILHSIPIIDEVSPVVDGNVQAKYLNNNTRTRINGAAITYLGIRNYQVEKGRGFTEAEVENRARVAVIGPSTAETLEFTVDKLGEQIKLNGINFTVVGILKSKGDFGWFNIDDQVLIPYTTAMNAILGTDALDQIDVQVKDGADLKAAEEQIITLMRTRHRLQPEQDDDFNVRNQADIIETASETNRTFTVLLGAIASISLLVGGIGIMNIMLVTVTERTREIGIRKAIGAKDRDILLQFLLEAMIMSCISGLIGVGLGYAASGIINAMSEFRTSVEITGVIVALSFAIGVGVFFGYYPAQRAAVLDPVDSLYYE